MSGLIDMTGWKMWEHGYPSSTLIVIKRADKTDSSKNVFWECECVCGKIHPNPLIIRGDHLRNGDTRGCGNTFSKGEEQISKLLKENNIMFERQKSFESCIFPDTKRRGYFDFYINNQYLLEYDGELHFQYKNNGWNNEEEFNKTIQKDKYKNQWCIKNNVPLIRIPYTHLKELSIDDLKLETSKFIITEGI